MRRVAQLIAPCGHGGILNHAKPGGNPFDPGDKSAHLCSFPCSGAPAISLLISNRVQSGNWLDRSHQPS